jgi:hypothetical protein
MLLGFAGGISWSYNVLTLKMLSDELLIRKVVIANVEAKTPENAEFDATQQICGLEDVICEGENPAVSEIVAKVYRLESSAGKNDSCKKNGKYNGYGYAQNSFSWICYDTQEEVKGLVTDWFNKNLKDKSVSEALCFYNEGIVKSDCAYYQRYLEL